MSVQDVIIETIKCDNPACDKQATYPRLQNGVLPETLDKNPWMKTIRTVQTGDGRTFTYCSGVCEVEGIKAGNHEPPAPKNVIEMPQGVALEAIKQAAQQEMARRQGTQALKEGRPVTLQPGA